MQFEIAAVPLALLKEQGGADQGGNLQFLPRWIECAIVTEDFETVPADVTLLIDRRGEYAERACGVRPAQHAGNLRIQGICLFGIRALNRDCGDEGIDVQRLTRQHIDCAADSTFLDVGSRAFEYL